MCKCVVCMCMCVTPSTLHNFLGRDTKWRNCPDARAHKMSYTTFCFHFACLCEGRPSTFAAPTLRAPCGPREGTQCLLMIAAPFCVDVVSRFQQLHLPRHAWWIFSGKICPQGLIVSMFLALLVQMHSTNSTQLHTTPHHSTTLPMHPSPSISTSTCLAALSWLIPYTRCHLLDRL